jgi:hypothetical protein
MPEYTKFAAHVARRQGATWQYGSRLLLLAAGLQQRLIDVQVWLLLRLQRFEYGIHRAVAWLASKLVFPAVAWLSDKHRASCNAFDCAVLNCATLVASTLMHGLLVLSSGLLIRSLRRGRRFERLLATERFLLDLDCVMAQLQADVDGRD